MTDRTDIPAIDEAALFELTGGDRQLGLDLVRIFRDELIGEAEQLARTSDPDLREELAHKLAGAARAIGAGRLAGLAAAVGRGAAPHELRAELERLAAEIERRLAEG